MTSSKNLLKIDTNTRKVSQHQLEPLDVDPRRETSHRFASPDDVITTATSHRFRLRFDRTNIDVRTDVDSDGNLVLRFEEA